jgi:H+-transporting ATPase
MSSSHHFNSESENNLTEVELLEKSISISKSTASSGGDKQDSGQETKLVVTESGDSVFISLVKPPYLSDEDSSSLMQRAPLDGGSYLPNMLNSPINSNPSSLANKPDKFELQHNGLSEFKAAQLLKTYGLNQLPEKVESLWFIFFQQFWQPMPLMIWAAIIIEAAIQNYLDMGILLLIQFANGFIGFYEITKAGDAVAALKNSLKPKATVKRDGTWKVIDASYLVPGDLVLLASGGAVPADCRVNKGQIDVDQSALTGESLPQTFSANDKCSMGSTVVRGETEGTVEFTGIETFLGKTAALLQGPVEISNMQKMLLRIVFILVVLSIILCVIVLVYLSTLTSFAEALSFVVVLMVASIPMAIEIVTTTTLALGSKELSAKGAIVTRLAAIEDLASMVRVKVN